MIEKPDRQHNGRNRMKKNFLQKWFFSQKTQTKKRHTFLFILLDIYFFKNIKRYIQSLDWTDTFMTMFARFFVCVLFVSCDYGFSFWFCLKTHSHTHTYTNYGFCLIFSYEFMCDLLYYGVFCLLSVRWWSFLCVPSLFIIIIIITYAKSRSIAYVF